MIDPAATSPRIEQSDKSDFNLRIFYKKNCSCISSRVETLSTEEISL